MINPFGRIIEVDTQQDYNDLLNKGFTIPSHDEIEHYKINRAVMLESMATPVETRKDVYLSTVSPGGKDGYGVASEKMIKELKSLGIEVSRSYEGQSIGILFHNPYSILRMETKYRVIFTMFESTKIPDDWHDYLEAADLVIVPSRWCADVFAKSGIKAVVVPLGYDDDIFTFKEKKDKNEAREDFVFLHYNAFNMRKGFLELLEAFQKAFEPTDPVKLILKTNLRSLPMQFPPSVFPNIRVINESYSDKDLAKLCQDADCFVFPSRGEGFGQTPLEAMACGTPAIVPNAHGISEYFNPDYMYEVKVAGESPAIYTRYKNVDVGKMSLCDTDDLAKQMRWVYEHQDQARDMGRKAAQYVKQWTFKETAKKLKTIIDDIKLSQLEDKPLKNVLQLEKVS